MVHVLHAGYVLGVLEHLYNHSVFWKMRVSPITLAL